MFSHRVVTWVAEVLASDLTVRTFLWLASLTTAGSSFVIPDQRTWLIALAGAFACSALLDHARLMWNYRGLDFVILDEQIVLVVKNQGKELVYRNFITLRARRPSVSAYVTLMGWSGSTKLDASNCKAEGRGVTLDIGDDPSGTVRCKFTFPPLARFRKTTVGLTFTPQETDLRYETWLGYATGSYMWSARSRLTFELRWDGTSPIVTDDIEAFVYRSRGEAVAGYISPLRKLASAQLKTLTAKEGRGRRWDIKPVHPHRYYLLRYELSKAREDAPGKSLRSSSVNGG